MLVALILIHIGLVNLDEHLFNKKRKHSKSEIISVITDGVLFLLPQLLAMFVTYTQEWAIIYKVLGAISMLSVVKNELFYQNLEVKERLTHACLYVLHPIILFTFYESWQNNYFVTHYEFWMFQVMYIGVGFKTICFKLVYWNFIHDK